MDIFEATKDLVDEGLEMGIRKWLTRADDGSEVTFHQLCCMLTSYSRPNQDFLPS